MAASPAFSITSRIVAVIVGGYAATVGMVALASVLLALYAGMQRSEAIVLTSIIGFVVYAAVIIWGFAERRLARIWLSLVGVAVMSHAAAIWLARLLPHATEG